VTKEPWEVRMLRERMKQAEDEIKGLKGKLEEEKYKALVSEIKSLRERISDLSRRPAPGYKEDTYRLLSESLSRIASIAERVAEKEPLERVMRLLTPPPPPTPAPSPEKEMLKELEKEGLLLKE